MGSLDGESPPGGAGPQRRRLGPPALTARGGSRPAGNDGDPTVLLVGAEQSFHAAIAGALAHHGVYVERAPISGVVESVVATAPDLVMLVGDAASDGGSAALASLHTSPHTSVVPVAILADDSALGERLRAFRHGAAAVIPRSASVDAIAEQVAKLAREIPDREREGMGNVGEATLQELVEALSKELRSGILSVRSGRGAEDEAIRIVLGSGRPIAQTIDEFVSRIRRHVVHAEPLHYEFDERAGGTVRLLGADVADNAGADNVSGLRVLLADEEAARADAVAQALREHKASVVVTDFQPTEQRFGRLRELDPTIFMIDEPSLRGAGYGLVRRLRRDTRLRWASLLVVRWEDVWSEADGAPTAERMLGTLATLAEPEQTLRERAELGTPFDTRLEITGPARMLRALGASAHKMRVFVYNPRVQIRVEFSDHLIAGARAQMSPNSEPVEGAVALAALLVLGSGRVHVEPLDEASLVNIMSTVDVALNLAEREASPIQPSMPAPADGEGLSMPPPARSGGWAKWLLVPAVLLGALAVAAGVLLVRQPDLLRKSLPAPASPAPAPRPARLPLPAAEPQAKQPPTVPAPKEQRQKASQVDLQAAEVDERSVAFGLESTQNVPDCDELVGPSWSLLNGDQPTRASTEVFTGRRALMVGKIDEAQVSFCRATVFDPNNVHAFMSLVKVFLMKRDPMKAKQWAERAVKHHTEEPEMKRLHADALARLGETDEAVSIWLSSLEVDPNDTATVRGLAYTYATGGERAIAGADYAQADRLLRRAALLDPSNAKASSGLSRILLLQGEAKAALAWAKRSVALEPRDSDMRVLLGDVHEKLGDTKEAHAQWRLAFELMPENKRASARVRRIPPE